MPSGQQTRIALHLANIKWITWLTAPRSLVFGPNTCYNYNSLWRSTSVLEGLASKGQASKGQAQEGRKQVYRNEFHGNSKTWTHTNRQQWNFSVIPRAHQAFGVQLKPRCNFKKAFNRLWQASTFWIALYSSNIESCCQSQYNIESPISARQ